MDCLFHQVDDAFAILRSRGVYKQAKVFHRYGRLYAAHGSGFVGLTVSGTTAPQLVLVDLIVPFKPETCALGRQYMPSAERDDGAGQING